MNIPDAMMNATPKGLRRLGAGWQHNAYDLGDGRVLKVPVSRAGRMEIAFAVHREDPGFSRDRAAAWADAVEKGTTRSYRLLENVLAHVDASLLGNPTLLGHGIYEQDKLLMIGDYFSHHTFAENAAVIDRYIDMIIALWQWGISEVVFNFTVNSGLRPDGTVVLCDLGELTLAQGLVRSLVGDQIWLHRWSYQTLPDERLKAYARTTLAERLTLARVDELWAVLRQDH